MSANLNLSIYTGQQSLLARQQEMATMANNLANVGRADYHRRTAILGSNMPLDTSHGQVGTGVHVAEVVRNFDVALENGLRQSLQDEGYSYVYAQRLEQIEAVMLTNGDSHLGQAVTDFAVAWQDLATMPDNQNARIAVIGEARNIASIMRRQDGQLASLQDSLASSAGTGAVADKLTTINGYLTEIANLNDAIVRTENRAFNRMQANDLRDQRDELVGKLSKLAEVSAAEEGDGSYTISLGGQTLVAGAATDGLQLDMSGGTPVIALASDGSAVTVASGEVGGLLDAWDRVATTRSELDAFAVALRDLVNARNVAGYDLDSNAGTNLFGGTSAATLSVLISDPRALAASDAVGETGNGNNARAMWDMFNTSQAGLSNASPLEYTDIWLNSLAMDVSQANDDLDSNEAITAMFRESINSASGVSLDEEMINMLQLQRAYQASAKFIATVDELLGAALSII